jgi:hypothetical protein
MRCVHAVTGEEPQVFEWTAERFDRFYREARNQGMDKAAAVAWAGDMNLNGAVNA